MQENLEKDSRYETLAAFMKMLQQYSPSMAIQIADQHCTPCVIERNGREKLIELFERLSADSFRNKADKFFLAGDKIQMIYEEETENNLLKVTLTFLENKLDRLSVEL